MMARADLYTSRLGHYTVIIGADLVINMLGFHSYIVDGLLFFLVLMFSNPNLGLIQCCKNRPNRPINCSFLKIGETIGLGKKIRKNWLKIGRIGQKSAESVRFKKIKI